MAEIIDIRFLRANRRNSTKTVELYLKNLKTRLEDGKLRPCEAKIIDVLRKL